MFFGWSLCGSVCRQKRILLLLCTFGSSFIAFNYSLLSSSSTTTIQAQKPFMTDKNDENTERQQRHNDNRVTSSPPHQVKGTSASDIVLELSYYPSLSLPNNLEGDDVTDSELLADAFSPEHKSNSVRHDKLHLKVNAKSSHVSEAKQAQKPTLSQSAHVAYPAFSKHDLKHIFSQMGNKRNNGNANESNNIYTTGNSPSSSNVYDKLKTELDQTQLAASSKISVESIINNNNNYSISNTDYYGVISNISPFPSVTIPQFSPTFSTSLGVKSSGTTNRNWNNDNDKLYTNSASKNLPQFQIPACSTQTQLRRVQKRKKNLTVIENFIMGKKRVKCNESITYTTHGDYRYLDNLVPLVERWDGPVSLAIYAPGSDLQESLKVISYFKVCTTSKIDEWVTFHLIYDVKYSQKPTTNGKPGDISWLDFLYQHGKWTDCSKKPTFSKGDHTFRMENRLLYPINIARNIARSAATTHLVLASDIELYPSINLIPSFMKMIHQLQEEDKEKTNYIKSQFTAAAAAVAKILFPTNIDEIFLGQVSNSTAKSENRVDNRQQNRHVFVLPVFEVRKEINVSEFETKEQLAGLLRSKKAILFHHSTCPQCHTFPKFDEWKVSFHHDSLTGSDVPPMQIFHTGKRKRPFQLWEPIFIGTKEEPIYDERLSWEGLRDKMVSGYIMCVLDYDFYVLDSAFLVHKPGIKRVSHLLTKTVMSQDRLINFRIRSELIKKFGKHDECTL